MAVETASAEHAALLDRDLSWLQFNARVLHEAVDRRTPLLERVKFLAIFSNNLDEFFMKRVEAMRHPAAEADGMGHVPSHLARVRQALLPLLAEQARVFTEEICPELARHGIHLLSWAELNDAQQRLARDFFRRNVFPVLTPLAVDPGHPFPFLSSLSTSLGIVLAAPESEERLFARVKIPKVFPQWVPLAENRGGPTEEDLYFVRLLDIIRHNLEDLFSGMKVLEVMPFRITRSAEVEPDDNGPAESLVQMVQEELRQRRFEPVVRLEYGPEASAGQLQLLTRKLGLSEADLYAMPAELDYTDLFALASLPRPELKYTPWQPVIPTPLGDEDADLFAVIRAGDQLVHHPYESFDASVARFVRTAAEDPRVLALKMTAYRVGHDTPFLDALIRAAEAGKQVACLVEVTARFDEQPNLALARALEKAGVHVIYGMVGLKTHCKTTLVVRQDDDGLRCYVHIGTGNYNVQTARLYTDVGLFTCDPALTMDVVELFHYLTGRSRKVQYGKLLVAPVNMRERFLALIEREIEHQAAGRPAAIVAKMNQLEDRAVCQALLRASQAGVPIDLIVRGFCTLAPGIPGVSANIRVSSVIGRFLEHSRIFQFRNGAEDPVAGEFFIGSADWMTRNLSERVEAVTPVEAPALRARLWEILQVMLRDHRQAWDLQPDGSYVQRTPPPDATGPELVGAQQTLMDWIRQRAQIGAN